LKIIESFLCFNYNNKTNKKRSIIMTITLQPLLSKDKQNPYLSIYKSETEPDKLEV